MQINIKTYFEDTMKYFQGQELPCDRHHLLVACMPKSGSTWLRTTLSMLPDFTFAPLVNGWDRREQEFSEVQLILFHRVNYISQLHIRYSEPTAKLMKRFSIRPIFLSRDIFDIVPSIRDHLRRESTRGSAAYILPDTPEWPNERIEEFLVEMALPWYFNLYLCWTECDDKLMVNYADMKEDMGAVVRTICDHHGVEVTDADIQKAVDGANQRDTRKNKAKTGRGKSLSDETRAKILHMASYYPDMDFSPIGITAEMRK